MRDSQAPRGGRTTAARARTVAVAAFLALGALGALGDGSPGTIDTVAGGGVGDLGPASEAIVASPAGMACDAEGNLYVADTHHDRVRRIDAATGVITTVAGSGEHGFSGDGGPATEARLRWPLDVAVDAAGNVYVADTHNRRVRRIEKTTGTISTVAGSGAYGLSGDDGPAVEAALDEPWGVAVDAAGNLFVADRYNARIRRVDAATRVITSVAGSGGRYQGDSGDDGPAVSATLAGPHDVAVDAAGNLFVLTSGTWTNGVATPGRIRRVDAVSQVITTYATTDATAIALDGAGNLFVTGGANQVLRADADGHATTVVAGLGTLEDMDAWEPPVYTGEGGPATEAELWSLWGVAVNADGRVYAALSSGYDRVVCVDEADGTIRTVAGRGADRYRGEGGPATSASFGSAGGVVAAPDGGFFVADGQGHRVCRVDAAGIVTTVAGTGAAGFSGDGGRATSAAFRFPADVAVDRAGNLFVADMGNARIRRVDGDGTVTTVAGNGDWGTPADGSLAAEAPLSWPSAVAVGEAGDLFIADGGNRILRVDTGGRIWTVAGTGDWGTSGDGGPAVEATFAWIADVAVGRDGALFIADMEGPARRVDASGIISTYPAGGASGTCSLALDGAGNLFGADYYGNRIWRADALDGTVSTIAGTGAQCFAGDGGPATQAAFPSLQRVEFDPRGNLLVAERDEESDGRVRRILGAGAPSNGAPVADAGADRTAEATSPAGAAVRLDGTASADPDGDALTYVWTGSFGSATGADATVTLGLGEHVVTLTVSDPAGATSADTVVVRVVDTTPPAIRASGLPDTLWPANHAMVRIAPVVAVADAADPAPRVVLAVSSSEPDDGLGDGDTAGDAVVRSATDLDLRAERSGKGRGRTYTLTWTATDASGNSATATVVVTVPRSNGR